MNFKKLLWFQLIILILGINHCAQGLREAVEFIDPTDFPVFSLAKKPELIWKRHLSSPPKDMMMVNNKQQLFIRFNNTNQTDCNIYLFNLKELFNLKLF